MVDLVLPESLRPWRAWLQWLPPELACSLGEIIQKIAPLLGTMRRQVSGDLLPEPDGLDDVKSRGPYDRLLATEWLLADVVPEEFLRRAVSGEHLFLMPRLRAPHIDTLIVATFDAGPLQFGAPRLVHLALWILLARRARMAGATFRWGILQAPSTLYPADTVHDLEQMLAARTWALEKGGLTVWEGALREQGVQPDEWWHIGVEPVVPRGRISSDAGMTHAVQVKTAIGAHALDVVLGQPGQTHILNLALPESSIGSRLLKGRFNTSARQRTIPRVAEKLAITRSPVIASVGRLVAVPTLGQPGVLVFPISREGGAVVSPYRQKWGGGCEPLAMTFCGQQLGAILQTTGGQRFWKISGLDTPEEPIDIPGGRGVFQPAVWLSSGSRKVLYVVNSHGALICCSKPNQLDDHRKSVSVQEVVEKDVMALVQVSRDHCVSVYRQPGGRLALHHHNIDYQGQRFFLETQAKKPDVLIAGNDLWRRGFGGCAIQEQAGEEGEVWHVYQPAEKSGMVLDKEVVTLPPGWKGVAVLREQSAGRVVMVALHPSGKVLAISDADRMQTLYSAEHAVRRFSFSPACNLVAMLTEARELIVYSLLDQELKLFVTGEGAHAAGE